MSEIKFRIAIDLMGSDKAPISELEGVSRFVENGYSKNTKFIFFGKKSLIEAEIPNHNLFDAKYEIVDCSEVITMHDDATSAIKTKKDSSIYKALEYHKSGECDAFISAGNTGVMLSTSAILLGRIKGVSRPTIGTFFPTKNKIPTLILDAGANVDTKPKYLYEFAIMGSIYFKEMFNLDNPKIALLNIGEEETKGNEVAQQTFKLLKESKLNFIGNAEGRDIFMGKADVIVCDGFTGNILLKFAESFLSFFKSTIKEYTHKSLFKKIKVALFAPTLKEIFRGFDYQEYGGVPLLGVNGVVIIGHGSSSGKAVESMIKRAHEIIERNLNKKIEEAINNI